MSMLRSICSNTESERFERVEGERIAVSVAMKNSKADQDVQPGLREVYSSGETPCCAVDANLLANMQFLTAIVRISYGIAGERA
jgi:hypothetical protein